MTLEPPRALLFDWDNTLVDTWHVIHHTLNATLQAMGHEAWTLAETRQRVRASARDTFPELFGARAEEAMALFYKTFEADHLVNLRERPGAGDMLSCLAGLGYVLGVVSNKRGHLLRREAGHLGWTDLFHRLVGAEDAARDKPAVEPVDLALDGTGLSRGPSVWFVGDTDIDMLCAVNAGCLPVLLRAERPAPGEFPQAAPRHHIADCRALADLLSAS